jgi:hypothetical protein
MATTALTNVVQHIRQMMPPADESHTTDEQLLACFVCSSAATAWSDSLGSLSPCSEQYA